MKKTVSAMLACVMTFVFVFQGAASAEKMPEDFTGFTEEQLAPYFDFAKEAMETYYRATMSEASDKLGKAKKNQSIMEDYKKSPLDGKTTKRVEKYLTNKLKYDTYHMEQMDYTKTYIDGKYILNDWEIINGILCCEIISDVIFQYSDVSDRSGFQNTTVIKLVNPARPSITDWRTLELTGYDKINNTDISLYTNISNNIYKKSFIENVSPTDEEKTLRSREKAVLEEKEYIENSIKNHPLPSSENSMPLNNGTRNSIIENPIALPELEISSNETNITTETYCSPATRIENMVNYARKNRALPNPERGSSQIPNYSTDFVNDCTNFISNCILAGGFSTVPGNNLQENGWYYNSMNDRSSTWAGVEPLYRFIKNNTRDIGPKQEYLSGVFNKPYKYSPEHIVYSPRVGDILQIKYNSPGDYAFPNFGHSTLITGFSPAGGSAIDIRITSRTRAGVANSHDNVKLSEYYSGASSTASGCGDHLFRFIRLDFNNN